MIGRRDDNGPQVFALDYAPIVLVDLGVGTVPGRNSLGLQSIHVAYRPHVAIGAVKTPGQRLGEHGPARARPDHAQWHLRLGPQISAGRTETGRRRESAG